MKNVLGVKNTHRDGENDKWLAVWDNIESYVYGTYPWTVRERVNGSYFDTFDELMGIDPRIVPAAADKLSLAREYMDERRAV